MEKLIGYNGVSAHFTIDEADASKLVVSLDSKLPTGVTFEISPSDSENPLNNYRQHLYIRSKEVFDINHVKKAVQTCLKS